MQNSRWNTLKKLCKFLTYIWAAITFLAALYGLFGDFSPQISTEKLSALDKKKPFSIPLLVRYNLTFVFFVPFMVVKKSANIIYIKPL